MMTPPPAIDSTLTAVGNTPLVKLQKVVPAGSADVYVKLEYYNPTGSYKDRMALAMIEEAEKRGDLRSGMTVVEYTGGSTGSSLAFICALKGYHFKVVSSDAFASEKLRTMQAFGADLTIVPSEGGKITPDLIPRMMDKAATIAQAEGSYATDQFNNHDSLKGYAAIGEEIVAQLKRPIHGFCGMVGTGGMIMGVATALRAAGQSARIIVLEPATSPIISQGIKGIHGVEGTGAGFIPPILDKSLYDEAWGIDEGEGRAMARRLAREEGVFTGISSGCNVVGAIRLAKELGEGHTVVTIAVDSGLKYLGGDLFVDDELSPSSFFR
jgi:cysteine synthase A